MSFSLIRAMFSRVVSSIEDDITEEPEKSGKPGMRILMGIFMAGIFTVSVVISLAVRAWNRIEMFFEMVQ